MGGKALVTADHGNADEMFELDKKGNVKRDATGSRCLLWAPNTDGTRAWSDTPGGQERLAHCKAAMERGSARALLEHAAEFGGYVAEIEHQNAAWRLWATGGQK